MQQFLNPLSILDVDGKDRGKLRNALKRKLLEFDLDDGVLHVEFGRDERPPTLSQGSREYDDDGRDITRSRCARKQEISIRKADFSDWANAILDNSQLLANFQRLLQWPELEWFLVCRNDALFRKNHGKHHRVLLKEPEFLQFVSSRFAYQYGLELEERMAEARPDILAIERLCRFTPIVLNHDFDNTYAPIRRLLKCKIDAVESEIEELNSGGPKGNRDYYRNFLLYLVWPRQINALPSFLDGDLNNLARQLTQLAIVVYNATGNAADALYISQRAKQLRTSGRDKLYVYETHEELSDRWQEAELHELHERELKDWERILTSIKDLIETLKGGLHSLAKTNIPVSKSQISALNNLPFIFDDVRNSLCWGLTLLACQNIADATDVNFGLRLLDIASEISVTDNDAYEALQDRRKTLEGIKDDISKQEQQFLLSTSELLKGIQERIRINGIRSVNTDKISSVLTELFCHKHIRNLAKSENRNAVTTLVKQYIYVLQYLPPDVALTHYNRLAPLRDDKVREEFLNSFHAQTMERKNKADGCFVATACYGNKSCDEVTVFRSFRDQTLSNSLPGRCFIHLYYTFSPSIAAKLKRRPKLSAFIRITILDPLYKTLRGGTNRDFK